MPFSPEVKAEALIDCGRRCCICHKYCGVRVECHHIVPEAKGGANDLANCVPLCFDCHAEVEHYNSQHPKGNKFTSAELKGHRDNWRRLLRESIIHGLESTTHPAAATKQEPAELSPKALDVSGPELLILLALTTDDCTMIDSVIAERTATILQRTKFHLVELHKKQLIRFHGSAYVPYWSLAHAGRRFLIENNLID